MTEYLQRPAGLPATNGYSHAVTFDSPMIAVSGQVPVAADGFVGDDGADQVRQVFTNLVTALTAAGSGIDQVVSMTVYLTDRDDLPVFRDVRDTFLDPDRLPACSLVLVAGLVDPRFRVEIDALATR